MLLARAIGITRGSKALARNISLSVNPGEMLVLLGPSGSGKSTLLKTLAGIIIPDSGAVTWQNQPLDEMADQELARLIALVPQDDIIHTRLSVESALHYAARLRLPPDTASAELDAAVDRVLRMTDLAEHRHTTIRRLSGGQRKRVNIGVELLQSARVLLLDEPTSGLDPALERDTMTLFKRLAGAGHAVVVSTHAMSSLDLADQLIVIADGRLVFLGPPEAAGPAFEVAGPAEIFRALKTGNADQWAARFQASPLARQAAVARRPRPAGAGPSHSLLSSSAKPETPRPAKSAQSSRPPADPASSKAGSPAPAKTTPQGSDAGEPSGETSPKPPAAGGASVDDLLARLQDEIRREEGA